MRLRPPVGADAPSTRDPSSDATTTDRNATAARTFLLVALAAVGVAYAVSRLRSSSGDDADIDASLETVRDRTAAALPSPVGDRVAEAVPAEPQSIPIGGGGADESGADEERGDSSGGPESESGGADTGESDDAAGGEPLDDAAANADLADDPSSTKISSGSSEEIQDKPAEPGEMTVEDDVEDLVDESLDDGDEDEE